MFNMMDIGGSALTAHKLYLDTVSNNIANINTPTKPGETGYKRQGVVFESFEDKMKSKLGVKAKSIVKSNRADRLVKDPDHPYADKDGYVHYPDIEMSEEMADMIAAQRGYQLNLNALNYVREMYEKTLEIGQ